MALRLSAVATCAHRATRLETAAAEVMASAAALDVRWMRRARTTGPWPFPRVPRGRLKGESGGLEREDPGSERKERPDVPGKPDVDGIPQRTGGTGLRHPRRARGEGRSTRTDNVCKGVVDGVWTSCRERRASSCAEDLIVGRNGPIHPHPHCNGHQQPEFHPDAAGCPRRSCRTTEGVHEGWVLCLRSTCNHGCGIGSAAVLFAFPLVLHVSKVALLPRSTSLKNAHAAVSQAVCSSWAWMARKWEWVRTRPPSS